MESSLSDELKAKLLAIEPDYVGMAASGPEIEPILKDLIDGDDARLAERAVVLAARISRPSAKQLVASAVGDKREQVRAAVAACSPKLSHDHAISVLQALLHDPVPSIRRLSINAAMEANLAELVKNLVRLKNADPEPVIRDFAETAVQRLEAK